MSPQTNRRLLTIIVLLFGLFLGQMANANVEISKIHFLIPGGAGGGWDATARGVGEALSKSDLVKRVSYQNMSGGGGGTGYRAFGKSGQTPSRNVDGQLDPADYPISTKDLHLFVSRPDSGSGCGRRLQCFCRGQRFRNPELATGGDTIPSRSHTANDQWWLWPGQPGPSGSSAGVSGGGWRSSKNTVYSLRCRW